MLTYSFDSRGPDSMYEQLYRHIREDILTGKLKAHEKLPSKRSFAKNLGVSNTTVENAYSQLVIEGYLYTRPKRGFFVSALEKQPPAPPPARGLDRPAEGGGGLCRSHGQRRGGGSLSLLRLAAAAAPGDEHGG